MPPRPERLFIIRAEAGVRCDFLDNAIRVVHSARVARLVGLRVIFVLPSLEMGGAERQALTLARYLRDEEDADVRVWGLGTSGVMARMCNEGGVPWHGVPLPPARARARQIGALIGFVRELRRAQPDVLLPYSRVPNRLCGLFWRMTGARLCVWNHRAGAIDPVPRWIDRCAARRTPLFVANSHHGAAYLAQTYAVPGERIHVVRNGIELNRLQRSRTEWRHRLGLDDRALLACMVANLTGNKDHATVLRAWAQAVPRLTTVNRPALLLLAGRLGDAYPAVKDIARSLDVESTVRFLGEVDDIAGLLEAVDIGVFASPMEGCPNGVLECMAAGLPIIGTNIAGIREAVGPEGLPYLVSPHEETRFAELLVSLASDPEARARIGHANRERIEQHFSVRQMGERMANLCAAHLPGGERVMRVPTAREFFFSPPPRDGHEHEQRHRAFYHAIRLRNGTNKTTYAHRLDTVNAVVNEALPARRPLDIMDVGVSSGISTLEWMNHLEAAGIDYRMTAGDVCINADLLRVANWLHVLIDREGYPLQFDVCGRAVPYPPGIRRGLLLPPLSLMMHAFRWVLPRVRAKRLIDSSTPVVLVDSQLHERAAAVIEDDLLAPQALDGTFDVVRAANVLNRCYFSDETLVRMAGNLRRRLKCGGILVVCRTDEQGLNHGTVFRAIGSPGLEVVSRIGEGSEIEGLVLRSVP